MSNPVSWFHHERQKVGVHKQMCLYGLPEVEALSVGKNRKGSTQRPLSTDEHDSETQTKTHISGYRVLTSVQLNYFSPSEAFCWLNTHKNRQSFKMKTLTLHLCGEMKRSTHEAKSQGKFKDWKFKGSYRSSAWRNIYSPLKRKTHKCTLDTNLIELKAPAAPLPSILLNYDMIR